MGSSSFRLFLPALSLFVILHAEAGSLNKKSPSNNNSIPAIFVFGDSTVDSGNNNYLETTTSKSNFPPYGTDFVNKIPTGRFTNGRLVTDFIASYLGIKEYIPAYLDPTLSLEELMTGVSFASASTGFDPLTSTLSGVISMQTQLEYLKEYNARLEVAIGKERTKDLMNKAAFVVSCGTNDFLVSFPLRRQTYTLSGYQQFMLQLVQNFLQGLLEQGARTIALVGLPPLGCLPVEITLASSNSVHSRECIESLSSIAVDYNPKLQTKLKAMERNAYGTRIVYADIYKPVDELTKNPSKFGFEEAHTGCCGSGYVESSVLCNPTTTICPDRSKYIFFDSVHPTEATYNYVFKGLIPTIDRITKK